MGFEVKIPEKLTKLSYLFDEKVKNEVAKTLEAALEEESGVISERTQAGRAIDGSSFDSYSPGYAAWKSGFTTAGRRRRKTSKTTGSSRAVRTNFGGGRVTLNLTGAMLRGLRSKIKIAKGYIEGTIFFISSQRDKARAHQLGVPKKNIPARPFFGLSKEQVIRINAKIKAALRI